MFKSISSLSARTQKNTAQAGGVAEVGWPWLIECERGGGGGQGYLGDTTMPYSGAVPFFAHLLDCLEAHVLVRKLTCVCVSLPIAPV